MKTDHVVKKFNLASLDAATYNPRRVSEAAMVGLRESLNEFGVLEMPVVNVHGGKQVLVSGHQRVAALILQGVKAADCVVVDFDDLTERMANVAMNNTATQGKFDAAKAAPEIQRMLAKMENPSLAGFDALLASVKAEVGKLEARDQQDADDAKDLADAKPEAPPVSKLNTAYKLGRHTVWCGDMQTGVKRMFAKRPASACITDPPYNVAYKSEKGESIANDDMPADQWLAMATEWFSVITQFTDGPCVSFYASRVVEDTLAAWTAGGGALAWLGAWVKDIPAISPMALKSTDYHYQTEPFLVGWRKGLTPKLLPECWNIVRCQRPRRNEYHPTQKPVALIRTFVERHTADGDLVLDPFLGSGSTLMACEETGRVCMGTELSPVFCDRIRRRWATTVHGEDAKWEKLTPPR
jgi:hypothetical protein